MAAPNIIRNFKKSQSPNLILFGSIILISLSTENQNFSLNIFILPLICRPLNSAFWAQLPPQPCPCVPTLLLNPEYGGGIFVRNAGIYVPKYTASHTTRQQNIFAALYLKIAAKTTASMCAGAARRGRWAAPFHLLFVRHHS
jgi:hypothetical protein